MALPPPVLTDALRDRFAFERELGRGGMGLIFLARDLRHNRQVAVKLIRPELASVVGSERFLREIQHAAQLQHPNIVPVYESGECEDTLYYVMPYVEGESLRARLRRAAPARRPHAPTAARSRPTPGETRSARSAHSPLAPSAQRQRGGRHRLALWQSGGAARQAPLDGGVPLC